MFAGRRLISSGLILFFALAFLVPGLGWPSPASAATSPTVTTNSASDIDVEEATLNGEIDSDGNSDITAYGFYYGTDSDPANEGTRKKKGSSIDEGDSFELNLTDLKEDTKYYFVAYATNDEGTDFGTVKYFTTDEDEDEDDDAPEVTTQSATYIGEDYGTMNALLESEGGSSVTEYGFYWGEDSDPVDEGTKRKLGTSFTEGDEFSLLINGLNEDTTYYFAAYAINGYDTTYGDVKSFTPGSDGGDKPEVTSNSASDIDSDGATLNAEIDSVGGSDIEEYGFYYGTSSSPSTKKTVGTDELDDGDEFDCDLTGLQGDTKYYFKAYAKNDDGTSYGDILNFTTDEDADDDSAKPSLTTKTPSAGDDNATLYGVVTSAGDSDIESYGFYYGTSSSPGTKVEVDDAAIDEDETFSYKLTNLDPGTKYYVKAYATNDDGTSYGSVLSFTVKESTVPTTTPVVSSTSPSVLTIGSKNYMIKGVSQTGDVAPFIKDSRTFLPIRPVAYAMGITDSNILWDAATQTVTLTRDSKVVKLKINSKIMTINGASISLDAPPQITDGRTCLPVALVAQAFGATVSWNAETQTVTIR